MPFHWLQGSPVLSQVLPDRPSILADGAAAAVLAFWLDLARSSLRPAWNWRRFVGPNKQGQQMVYIPGPTTAVFEYLDALWAGDPMTGQLPHGLSPISRTGARPR